VEIASLTLLAMMYFLAMRKPLRGIQFPCLHIEIDLVQYLLQVLQHLLAPEPEYHIAHIPQGLIDPFILLHVPFDLRNPKTTVRFDPFPVHIPILPMPEFPIDKNGQSVFFDQDIRLSWHSAVMDTEAIVFCP